MGEVFLAGKEADEGAALFGGLVADGATEHGIFCFEGIEDGALGDGGFDVEVDFPVDAREGAEMLGEDDSDHGHFLRPRRGLIVLCLQTHGLRRGLSSFAPTWLLLQSLHFN